MTASIGKWRRLAQAASSRGAFSIMAIDHRGPLRRSLQTESGGETSDVTLSALKLDVVRALAPAASAVLLDPETGVAPCVATRALPGDGGLIVALDTGSTGDPANVSTSLVEGWGVEKSLRVGAAGVKLLLYYHPESPDAGQTEALVKRVADDCTRYDVPLFLEPLSHGLDAAKSPLPSAERAEVVVETARRLVPLGVDVLKAEFPVDAKEVTDETAWRVACERVTEACPVPWVLLSAGVTFDVYLRQVRVACDSGASGVMAGRAVWREAVSLDVAARNHFLYTQGRERMQQLRTMCDALARPFDEVYERPTCYKHDALASE